MARAIWQGHLSFGLVTIPVELYSAVHDDAFDLKLLDRRDNAPVGYRRVNKETGEEVPSADIVKGYEHEKGEYVILTDDDLKNANVEATQTIDILAFVDAGSIPPQFLVKPYFVVPGKKSARPYALLRETMRETGKVALAKVVIRTRQHLASIEVQERGLVLELLRYATEVLDVEAFPLPGEALDALGVSTRELAMARQLVEGLAAEWDPTAYRDEYRDDLLAIIEEKARTGHTAPKRVPGASAPADEGNVVDIMALLRESVAQAKSRAAPPRKKHAAQHAKP